MRGQALTYVRPTDTNIFMTEKLHGYVEKLKKKDEAWVAAVAEGHGEVTVVVPRESIVDVCRFLKEEHGFDLLADL